MGDRGVKQRGRKAVHKGAFCNTRRTSLLSSTHRASGNNGASPTGKQQCSRARGQVLQAAGGQGVKETVARALWYLHSNVGAMGGGQQCHLLMTEQGDVRFL